MNKAETDMNAFLNNLEGGRADKVALRDSKTAFKLMGKAIEPMKAALLEVQNQADDLDDEDTARHGLRQMLAASLETMASIEPSQYPRSWKSKTIHLSPIHKHCLTA